MARAKIDPLMQKLNDLVSNTILKQVFRAERNETTESARQFFLYENAMLGLDNIYDYQLDESDIAVSAPHLSANTVRLIAQGRAAIEDYLQPEMISYLLDMYRTRRMSEYEELNNYYRMLMGLPPIEDKPEDYIYVDDKPIHELSQIEIYRLKQNKILNIYIGENPDKKYLFYLDKRIDFYQARKADVFEVLYTPTTTEYLSYRGFVNKERNVWLRNFTNVTMNRGSDYNEAMESTAIKMTALIYWYISQNSPELNKNEYTQEEAKNIWRTFGVSLPKNMPADYRNSVTYIMNYLTRYKGTNFDVKFVSEKIFSGLKLYKYFIRKKPKAGLTYPIKEGTNPEDVYDIEFILRPFDATNIPDFKEEDKKEDRILSYDEVVALDPRWRDAAEIKKAIFNSDFSYVNSKYLSLDNYIDLSKFGESFTIVERCLIERKRLLTKVDFNFSGGTGITHNFFNIMVYYLGILTTLMVKLEIAAPDTLKKYKRLMGFRVPEKLQDMKEYFLSYMTQHGYNEFVNEFPEAMNDDQQFIDLLINIDKAVGIAELFHEIIRSCHNFPEIECMTQIYKMVRVVNTVPEVYNMNVGSIDGLSYIEYLRENDPELGERYDYIVRDDTNEKIISEMDMITQLIVKMVEEYEQSIQGVDLSRVKNAFTQANIFINGISKYLLYILKIYKAYSADFLTDGNIYEFNPEYNYQMNIDQMRIDFHVNEKVRWNVSQYDQVTYSVNFEYDENQISSDMLVKSTPYGDIIIGED